MKEKSGTGAKSCKHCGGGPLTVCSKCNRVCKVGMFVGETQTGLVSECCKENVVFGVW